MGKDAVLFWESSYWSICLLSEHLALCWTTILWGKKNHLWLESCLAHDRPINFPVAISSTLGRANESHLFVQLDGAVICFSTQRRCFHHQLLFAFLITCSSWYSCGSSQNIDNMGVTRSINARSNSPETATNRVWRHERIACSEALPAMKHQK